jgi:sulfoxide reductase heme-binding subunit YedZ
MSVGYTWVQWSRHKKVYDLVVAAAAALYVSAFVGVSLSPLAPARDTSLPVLLIRGTGSCAIVMLHAILMIGPLSRLDRRFLPLLYNRRHLGVATFLIALAHATMVLGYYHGFGVVSPLVSLLGVNANFLSLRAFPFQVLGLGALLIMFVMAATSHDFWLRNLSPATWKRIHMLVYGAYALLAGHVALGALQNDRGVLGPAAMFAGLVAVGSLHLAAGAREVLRDRGAPAGDDAWIDAGLARDVPEGAARTVCARGGERIAVFRHQGRLSAVANVCAHQGGPLGEGRIIDGCITCPWHGWQYRPGDGCSPPPFTEKIPTYRVRVVRGRVQVDPRALPAGTFVEPVPVEESS